MKRFIFKLCLLFLKYRCIFPNEGWNKTFYIDENLSIGTLVGKITTVQSDFNPPYSVHPIAGKVEDAFEIDEISGDITTKIKLDHESQNKYQILVSDVHNQYVDIFIKVNDLNDNYPVFASYNISLTLPESSPKDKTKLQLTSVSDADSGVNSTAGCKIVDGNEQNHFRLSVRKLSQRKLTLELIINADLDRENISDYSLVIVAFDGGSPAKVANLYVNITILDVNDHQPVFRPSYYSRTIQQTLPIPSKLLQVYAYDLDIGNNGKIRYLLNHEKSDHPEKFSLDAVSGILSLVKPLRDIISETIKLVVIARDLAEAPQQGSAVISLTIPTIAKKHLKLSVQFLQSYTKSGVSEDVLLGTRIAIVTVSPNESSFVLNTDINMRLSGHMGFFSLISKSQNVYELSVTKNLNREKRALFNITITAEDSGNMWSKAEKSLLLYVKDVNDNPPIFTNHNYMVEITESIPIGSAIIQISATDADSKGPNSDIRYSLKPSQPDWFDIYDNSGVIFTKSLLDCEILVSHKLTVIATDQGEPKQSSTCTVTVIFQDYRHEKPIFHQSFYTATLPENYPVYSCFLRVIVRGRSLMTLQKRSSQLTVIFQTHVVVIHGLIFVYNQQHCT